MSAGVFLLHLRLRSGFQVRQQRNDISRQRVPRPEPSSHPDFGPDAIIQQQQKCGQTLGWDGHSTDMGTHRSQALISCAL